VLRCSAPRRTWAATWLMGGEVVSLTAVLADEDEQLDSMLAHVRSVSPPRLEL
jgi:hypothetical protein